MKPRKSDNDGSDEKQCAKTNGTSGPLNFEYDGGWQSTPDQGHRCKTAFCTQQGGSKLVISQIPGQGGKVTFFPSKPHKGLKVIVLACLAIGPIILHYSRLAQPTQAKPLQLRWTVYLWI